MSSAASAGPIPAGIRPTGPNGLGSTVCWSDGTSRPDTNGFVTALGVRELRRSGRPVPAAWLDVLDSCRRPNGAFGFWPAGAAPSWAPDLPPDSDDTAVMLLELTLAGRIRRPDARRFACATLGRQRLRRVLDPGPPWLRRGMFTTWQRPGRGAGIVDLTVVVNTLAVLHELGLSRIPGVAESLDGLTQAVRWAAGSRLRWCSLSPFYPEPDELARALDHAAELGVPGAAGHAVAARADCPRIVPAAICSMAYGPPTWHSQELAELRHTCEWPC